MWRLWRTLQSSVYSDETSWFIMLCLCHMYIGLLCLADMIKEIALVNLAAMGCSFLFRKLVSCDSLMHSSHIFTVPTPNRKKYHQENHSSFGTEIYNLQYSGLSHCTLWVMTPLWSIFFLETLPMISFSLGVGIKHPYEALEAQIIGGTSQPLSTISRQNI